MGSIPNSSRSPILFIIVEAVLIFGFVVAKIEVDVNIFQNHFWCMFRTMLIQNTYVWPK